MVLRSAVCRGRVDPRPRRVLRRPRRDRDPGVLRCRPPRARIPTATRRSPRERLLEAAGELFYAEGVQSVGIDRVIERAGVAKASLYSTFGSKEELRPGLPRRAPRPDPRPALRRGRRGRPGRPGGTHLREVFDAQAELFERPGLPRLRLHSGSRRRRPATGESMTRHAPTAARSASSSRTWRPPPRRSIHRCWAGSCTCSTTEAQPPPTSTESPRSPGRSAPRQPP